MTPAKVLCDEHHRRWRTRLRKTKMESSRSRKDVPMTPPAAANSAQHGISSQPLTSEQLRKINAYWRAANYLSVGQIYLYANPLLREPLKIEHIKPRLLGHFGTTPGLNFIYAHFNRL